MSCIQVKLVTLEEELQHSVSMYEEKLHELEERARAQEEVALRGGADLKGKLQQLEEKQRALERERERLERETAQERERAEHAQAQERARIERRETQLVNISEWCEENCREV